MAQQGAFHITQAPAVLSRRRQIAMIGDLNLPQCRKYRVEQLTEFWKLRNVQFDYAHFEDIPRATRLLQQATHVMEYRLQHTEVTEMLRYETRRLRLPILYDLDDPLFSVPAYQTYGNMTLLDSHLKQHFLKAAPRYLSMMNGADMISVSTPGLAAHARMFTHRPVHLRRNFADRETLNAGQSAMAQRRGQDDLYRVAFASGSQGHEADLNVIADPLSAFIRARPERRLLILGHFDMAQLPSDLERRTVQVGFRDYPQYLAALAQADCAVMPLAADTFNTCKSAVRVIDAAAVGVPCIVSEVGDLSVLIEGNATGHVARTKEDWRSGLELLVRDRTLGAAARAHLETCWATSDAPHIVDRAVLEWVAA